MRCVLMLLVLVLTIGCGDSKPANGVVPLEQIPAPLLKIARETLPDVAFDHAYRKSNGDWEIKGKNRQGKVREVELKPSGELVEIE